MDDECDRCSVPPMTLTIFSDASLFSACVYACVCTCDCPMSCLFNMTSRVSVVRVRIALHMFVDVLVHVPVVK